MARRGGEAGDGDRMRAFARGLGEAAGVIALTVAFGLAAAGLLGAGGARAGYPASDVSEERRRLVLVDGFNVLHACVLQGRDRAEWWKSHRRVELLELAARYEDPDVEIVVVFDGPDPEGADAAECPGVRQVFAPSADEWLLERVKARGPDERITLVTGDRQLADRAENRGATRLSPHEFVRRCR